MFIIPATAGAAEYFKGMKPFSCHMILAGVCTFLLLYACHTPTDRPAAEEGDVVVPSPTTDTLNGIDQQHRSNKRWNQDIEANFHFMRMHADTSGNTYALGFMGGIFHYTKEKGWEKDACRSTM